MFTSILAGCKFLLDVIKAWMGHIESKDRLRARKRTKREKSFLEAGRSVDEVYLALDGLLHSIEEADRVTIFRSHNGNGVPKPGKPLYSSVAYECFTDNVQPIRRIWKALPVDGVLAASISSMIHGDMGNIKFNEIKSCYLKTIAKSNKEIQALTFYITSTDDSLYYLSIASTTRDTMEEDSSIIWKGTQAVNVLRDIIE